MAEVGNAQRDNAPPSLAFFKDEYTITSGMILTIKHGLPKAPRFVWLRLKNIVAELGYAIGDEIELTNTSEASAASNATSIKVVLAGRPTVVDFSNNNQTFITAADWTLIVKAEVY